MLKELKQQAFTKASQHIFYTLHKFACTVDIHNGVSGHVETVCLLSKKNAKPKDCVEISVDAEDYYRIKSSEKDI